MTEHIFDELPSLLNGQSNRAELMSAAAHLRECTDCQQELINAVVAHSSLSSAARYTPGVAPAVLSRMSQSSSLVEPQPAPLPDAVIDDSPLTGTALPDLSALFAAVREEASNPPAKPDGPDGVDDVEPAATAISDSPLVKSRRGFSGRWLIAAAVVGLGLGSAGVLAAKDSHTAQSSTTVALTAYDAGSTSATAKVVGGDDMKLDASTLPAPASGDLYEVWLTNGSRTKMHALGWINTDGKGEFTVPPELMGEYSAIEVSVQKLDSSYLYSGTSVLRGTY